MGWRTARSKASHPSTFSPPNFKMFLRWVGVSGLARSSCKRTLAGNSPPSHGLLLGSQQSSWSVPGVDVTYNT
eukprot:8999213-Pyramimonas_sp.AAC.1